MDAAQLRAYRNYYVQLLKNSNTKTIESHEPIRSDGLDAIGASGLTIPEVSV
jgi:hypothetical protein